ncbi:hypothetical protein Esi_0036_0054 [Ectocarpus siliculosus]|uniref:Uncharacterized protein n=1 Tax=Ectocarpus siliculosus TaxID=2880 RepID=D8LLB3_ECTSI|nr:hypothetical protein Esi_0036_0054 [Ectocarpus siliculosus]|eukprot:CBN77111.1 hypothetical protein Esi_0036_0054 [Ectocarpus siliculosus]
MMMIPGRDADGGVADGSSIGARKRPSPSQGGWFYTSSTPAVSEGVAAARIKRATGGKAEMAGGNDHPAAAGDPWAAGAARGNPYARSGAGAAAAAAAAPCSAGGPPEKSAHRDSYRYAPTNGRHWETYRDQEDSYPMHPKVGGVGWYDSEESGLSRLTSCDSASSTWDEMHARPGAGGGGDVFNRSRSRAMVAMEMAPADAGGAGACAGGRDPRDPLRDRGGYSLHHPVVFVRKGVGAVKRVEGRRGYNTGGGEACPYGRDGLQKGREARKGGWEVFPLWA